MNAKLQPGEHGSTPETVVVSKMHLISSKHQFPSEDDAFLWHEHPLVRFLAHRLHVSTR